MTRYREEYAVDVDGELVTCVDGQLSGPKDIVDLIKYNVLARTEVRLVQPYGRLFVASLNPEDRLGIVAALTSPSPGRSRVLTAPEEVWNYYALEEREER